MNFIGERDGGGNIQLLAVDRHLINYEFYNIPFKAFCHYFRLIYFAQKLVAGFFE